MPNTFAMIKVPYQLKVETKDSKGQKYNHGGIQLLAEIQPKTAGHQAVAGNVEDHKDGTYTITFTPQVTGPHQLLITMDGEHIRNSPYDLKVRASKPDYCTISNIQQLNTNITSPLCMAIHNSGDIFIGSESNCIYVFNQAGFQKAVIGSAGDAGGQFNKPSGLAIKGDVLYVADCNNHRIQKLSINGEFLHMFGKLGSGQGEFKSPSAVVVDSNDRLIVSDRGNSRILVMDSDGTFFLSLDGRSVGFQNIFGLALDSQGNIHVSDSAATIRVLAPSKGMVRSYALPVGHTCTCITFDAEGHTLICVEGNNSVAICDPLGYYYHSVMIPSGFPKGIGFDPMASGSFYVVVGSQLQAAHRQRGVPVRSVQGPGILLKCEV